jgi:hypothetical protein
MLDIVKIKMPEKNVYTVKRGINKIPYVYYVLKTYRNDKGQPTNDSVLIGKKDNETGLLIPNDKFFTIFDCDITINVKGLK